MPRFDYFEKFFALCGRAGFLKLPTLPNGDIRSKIDATGNAFSTGGIPNPFGGIGQIGTDCLPRFGGLVFRSM